ncbi:MAG: PEGA domain-containing protein [candidate division WOR-3 bacterium]
MRKVVKVLLCILLVITVAWAEKICPNCGTANRDDARFCKKCGARLPEPESRPSLPRLRVTASVEGNSVIITSEPSGATVRIDDVERGKTPLTITELAPGRHELEVRLAGYQTYYSSFNITARLATLVVTSDPTGADIYLDGAYKGKTTETGLTISRVPFGSHSISARLTGYQEATKLVEVREPGPIGILIKLGTSRGFLSVTTRPAGADVIANGRKLGTAPLVTALAPDRYALTLSKPGYEDWLGYVNIGYGETTAVNQTLSRLPQRQLPILLTGIVLTAGGALSALMGEKSYAAYQQATTTQEAIRLHQETERWDMLRNIGFGAGAGCIGLYFVIRW